MLLSPTPLRRIAFTCDLLRFSPSEGGYRNAQLRNLSWLREILMSAPAWSHRQVQSTVVVPPQGRKEFADCVGDLQALRDYTADPDAAWAARYADGSCRAFATLIERLAAHDLVVGFELPPGMKAMLSEREVPYLSVHIHPLRFLRDLALSATTNSAPIADQLARHAIPQAEILRQMQSMRARLAMHPTPAFAFPADLPVLVGQTARDSVLISEGRFVNWADHESALEQALEGHDAVVLLEHPYRSSSADIANYLRSRLRKTVVSTSANGYGVLLSGGARRLVLTLASSLAVEAQFMGHETRFLLGDPRSRLQLQGVDIGGTEPLGHGALASAFWERILLGSLDRDSIDQAQVRDPFDFGDNFLRTSLGARSYGLFQQGWDGIRVRKTLWPAECLSPARNAALRSQLGFDDTEHDANVSGVDTECLLENGLHLQALGKPLQVGEERQFNFSGPSMWLLSGFHAPESWGVWTRDPIVQIVIPVNATSVAKGARLRVEMEMGINEGILARGPVVRVHHGTGLIGYAFFRTGFISPLHLEFDVPLNEPSCTLSFEITDSAPPASHGATPDRRHLGWSLLALKARVLASESTSEPPESGARSGWIWGLGAARALCSDAGAPGGNTR